MRSRGMPCSGPTLVPGDPQGAGRKLSQGSSLGRLFQERKGSALAGEGCRRLGQRNASGLQNLQPQRWGVTQGPAPPFRTTAAVHASATWQAVQADTVLCEKTLSTLTMCPALCRQLYRDHAKAITQRRNTFSG